MSVVFPWSECGEELLTLTAAERIPRKSLGRWMYKFKLENVHCLYEKPKCRIMPNRQLSCVCSWLTHVESFNPAGGAAAKPQPHLLFAAPCPRLGRHALQRHLLASLLFAQMYTVWLWGLQVLPKGYLLPIRSSTIKIWCGTFFSSASTQTQLCLTSFFSF